METSTREVNADAEVIPADAIPGDEPEEDEDGDEEVIPPVEEGEEPAEPDEGDPEEPEEPDEPAPSDSSPEDPTAPKDDDPEEPSAPSQTPAPVEGETPREKALRLEVQRLKALRRKEGIQELIAPPGAPAQPSATTERLTKLKERYTPEELAGIEEAIDVIAESKGYVKKSETYQEQVNTLVDEFTSEHTEYKPENDPEDVRWTRFTEILSSGLYNLHGKTPQQLKAIFGRVHKDVTEELGEPTVAVQPRRQAAQRQKVRSVSHSGGTKPTPQPAKPTVDPKVRDLFKGFDDDDLG